MTMEFRRKDYFAIHSRSVELYLSGERKSPLIRTTPWIAHGLEKRYHVILQKEETINEEKRLYSYRII